jgi:hypothetical protein
MPLDFKLGVVTRAVSAQEGVARGEKTHLTTASIISYTSSAPRFLLSRGLGDTVAKKSSTDIAGFCRELRAVLVFPPIGG